MAAGPDGARTDLDAGRGRGAEDGLRRRSGAGIGRRQRFEQTQQDVALRRIVMRQSHQRLAGHGQLQQPVNQQQIRCGYTGGAAKVVEQHEAEQAEGQDLLQALDQERGPAQSKQCTGPGDEQPLVATADGALGPMYPDRHSAEQCVDGEAMQRAGMAADTEIGLAYQRLQKPCQTHQQSDDGDAEKLGRLLGSVPPTVKSAHNPWWSEAP